MVNELSQFAVQIRDWSLKNILLAPSSPPGLPSKPSPGDGHRVYKLRMVDFEIARKFNEVVTTLNDAARANIGWLAEDLTTEEYVEQYKKQAKARRKPKERKKAQELQENGEVTAKP